jgi:hypothetical protein
MNEKEPNQQKKRREKPISLYPLPLEEIVTGLFAVKPPPKDDKKQPKKKRASS